MGFDTIKINLVSFCFTTCELGGLPLVENDVPEQLLLENDTQTSYDSAEPHLLDTAFIVSPELDMDCFVSDSMPQSPGPLEELSKEHQSPGTLEELSNEPQSSQTPEPPVIPGSQVTPKPYWYGKTQTCQNCKKRVYSIRKSEKAIV